MATAYEAWRARVERAGGFVTAWPDRSSPYYGQWAAKYAAAVYTAALSSGAIGSDRPTTTVRDTSGADWVYVLAPDDANADGPQVMTAAQRAANYVFSKGDEAATALGLPSLASWTTAAKWIAGAAAFVLVLLLLAEAARIRRDLVA